MDTREEYDALKKCLSKTAYCFQCHVNPCGSSEARLARLLTLHGEMVAREIYKEATGERTLYGVSPLSEAEMLDIARKAGE